MRRRSPTDLVHRAATVIGYPAPNLMDTGRHGAALGGDDERWPRSEDRRLRSVRRSRSDVLTRRAGGPRQTSPRTLATEFDAWGGVNPSAKALLDRLLTRRSCPTAGTPTCPTGNRGPRRGTVRPQVRVSRSGRNCRSCGAVRPTWPGQQQHNDKGADSFGPALD